MGYIRDRAKKAGARWSRIFTVEFAPPAPRVSPQIFILRSVARLFNPHSQLLATVTERNHHRKLHSRMDKNFICYTVESNKRMFLVIHIIHFSSYIILLHQFINQIAFSLRKLFYPEMYRNFFTYYVSYHKYLLLSSENIFLFIKIPNDQIY